MDRALLDARERRVVLVERDDLHLRQLVRLRERLDDERRIVAEEADHAADVGMLRDRVLDVCLGLRAIKLIRECAEDLEAVRLQHIARRIEVREIFRTPEDRINHALPAALRVVLFEAADEKHHAAALRHRLAHEVPAHAARLVVVHADVEQPLALRRVRVVRDHLHTLRGFVQQLGLAAGIDRAHGDAVHAAREQLLDLPFLSAEALGRPERLRVHAEFFRPRLHARRGDRPERRDAIRDVGDFHLS